MALPSVARYDVEWKDVNIVGDAEDAAKNVMHGAFMVICKEGASVFVLKICSIFPDQLSGRFLHSDLMKQIPPAGERGAQLAKHLGWPSDTRADA